MKAKDYLILSVTMLIITLLLLAGEHPGWAGRRSPSDNPNEFQASRERVTRLQEDISTLNLLNGLNLTREQTAQVLALAREAQEARARATVNAQPIMASLREAEDAYRALKTEIEKGAPARGAVPTRAAQVNHRLKELEDQANRQLSADFENLEGRLRQTLSPEQVQVVETFKPCLIPPLDLRDPVRAGQASSNEGIVKRLRRLRAVPEDRWQARRQEIARRIVDKYSQNHFRLTDAEKAAEQHRLLALLEKARRLSDMDFEMEKDALAEELKPQDRMKDLREQVEARAPHTRAARMGPLGRFLLTGRVVPILEQRLAAENLAAVR